MAESATAVAAPPRETLSVIIPAYNEAATIHEILDLVAYLRSGGNPNDAAFK